MNKCPMCTKGKLVQAKEKKTFFGVELGTFPVEICNRCGETFTDENVMEEIEKNAKEKGIWGLGKQSKVTKTGNSLAIRIPKQLARYLGITENGEVYMHP